MLAFSFGQAPRSYLLPVALSVLVLMLSTMASGDRPARPVASQGVAGPAPHVAPDPEEVPRAVERILRVSVSLESNGVYGAGFLIDPHRGLILTSYHVVEDMQAPRASMRDGRRSSAQVIATDRALDVALLSAEGLKSPHIPPPQLVDAARLRPGEEVFAVGSPRKLPFTVSRGIVSFVEREMEDGRYLQLDMAINDGNSGGPVFTRHGELVGMMSFILRRAQGLAFALPVTAATRAFPSVLNDASTSQVHEPRVP
ncbi:MAG: serine protease [Deltaproteobacteria bacterium]|nr:serine protease [Deltaproteobacteria bacterium]